MTPSDPLTHMTIDPDLALKFRLDWLKHELSRTPNAGPALSHIEHIRRLVAGVISERNQLRNQLLQNQERTDVGAFVVDMVAGRDADPDDP